MVNKFVYQEGVVINDTDTVRQGISRIFDLDKKLRWKLFFANDKQIGQQVRYDLDGDVIQVFAYNPLDTLVFNRHYYYKETINEIGIPYLFTTMTDQTTKPWEEIEIRLFFIYRDSIDISIQTKEFPYSETDIQKVPITTTKVDSSIITFKTSLHSDGVNCFLYQIDIDDHEINEHYTVSDTLFYFVQ